jgi:uncharacterized protein
MPTAGQVWLAAVGPALHAASWLLVRWRGWPILATSGITMAVLGTLAAVIGPVSAATRFDVLPTVGIGVASGAALYLATVVFMAGARRVPAVARHTADLYAEEGSTAATVAVSVLVSAPGEELIWRGVVLGVLSASLGSVAPAALLSWAGFVLVNSISGRIPIVLGAVVGGGVWTALAWWTGGVAAPIACHALWTGLMVVLPPPGANP